MKENPALFSFNRGLVSALALARIDQKRVALSAETMNNFVCRALGPMSFRPGLGYLGATASNAAARMLKFIFSTADTALVELTNLAMRVWISDALVSRSSVSTAITNGTFTANITGWTSASESGASAAVYEATDHLKLVGDDTARSIAYQDVTVAAADQSVKHGIDIDITRGPVTVRIGNGAWTTTKLDDLMPATELDTGYHSLEVTPTGATFFIELSSKTIYKKLVNNCTIESSGVMSLTTIWPAAALSTVRYDQSGDILFVACDGYRPQKIERRGTRPGARSWSVCDYVPNDGPFLLENTTPVTMTVSATTGDTTLTASKPYFYSTHVGALFNVETPGQTQTASLTAQNTFTSSIKVTGVGSSRSFGITLTGVSDSTITLQSSTDDTTFVDVAGQSFTSNTTTAYQDGLDNQIIYYKIGIKTGDYGSDTVVPTLNYAGGTTPGRVRVTAYSTVLAVSVQVLKTVGAATATAVWAEGSWSSFRGFPTSVRFHEGRLWWFGRNGVWGSVSDAYNIFDAETEGASGPINRSIGAGAVDVTCWALSLQRLVIGTEGKELSAQSSNIDSPLTAADFNLKDISTQGSAKLEALEVDQKGIFVQRNAIKVYEASLDSAGYNFTTRDLTAIVPDLCDPGIVRIDVQRQPDTRIHCVRSDGTVCIAIYDANEEVLAWQTMTPADDVTGSGTVEDVVVLPATSGSTEDQVYYVVNRTINGSTVRYLEKWAKESECRGSTTSKNIDSFVSFTNSPASGTVTGLGHLVGESVVVWADGAPVLDSAGAVDTFTVSAGGTIVINSASVSSGIVGLSYVGQWKSAKLGIQPSIAQTTLNRHKRLNHLGLILAYFYPKGLEFGPDFTNMDDMPTIEAGTTLSGVQTSYDYEEIPFPGTWTTDARLCLQATSPRPVTVLAASIDLTMT